MNKRQISKILRESVFKPSEATGLLSVILDADNVDYYINRAIECVKLAKKTDNTPLALDQLTTAISLLALVKFEYINEKTKNI